MTVEEAVVERIAGLAGVTAIVANRVYLLRLPQSPVYPCVRVALVSDPPTAHLRGPNAVCYSRVQVDMYARAASGINPYTQAAQLDDAVRGDGRGPAASGLDGWRGLVVTVEMTSVHASNRTVRFDPDEIQVLTMTRDYDIWYR